MRGFRNLFLLVNIGLFWNMARVGRKDKKRKKGGELGHPPALSLSNVYSAPIRFFVLDWDLRFSCQNLGLDLCILHPASYLSIIPYLSFYSSSLSHRKGLTKREWFRFFSIKFNKIYYKSWGWIGDEDWLTHPNLWLELLSQTSLLRASPGSCLN